MFLWNQIGNSCLLGSGKKVVSLYPGKIISLDPRIVFSFGSVKVSFFSEPGPEERSLKTAAPTVPSSFYVPFL